MNYILRGCSKCCFIAVLACSFLVSSQMSLLASPPQSGQSSNSNQKPDDPLPDAPQAQSSQTAQQPASTPSGAAGAKAAETKGAPVAQPAGAAVAPVRQHGHRSLLIKIGLIAGAGIAVGSVVALSERSPSHPPGTSSTSTQR